MDPESDQAGAAARRGRDPRMLSEHSHRHPGRAQGPMARKKLPASQDESPLQKPNQLAL